MACWYCQVVWPDPACQHPLYFHVCSESAGKRFTKGFRAGIPGFGCNASAVMATRTIESHRSRLIAILATPYVSCSARLPVFILFAGAFFGEWAGTMVFALYAASVAVALGSFEPLGFGWKDSIAILSGLLSKEMVVSSYAVLNSTDKSSNGRQEAGDWRWAGVSFGVSLVMAWTLAFATLMIGGLFV